MSVSIALGCLYINNLRVDRTEAELILLGGEVDEDSARSMALLDVYTDMTYTLPALIFGTAGVGLLGFGGVMTVLGIAERIGVRQRP